MNEKDLVTLLKQSDPAAMHAIFVKFHPPLCLLVNRLTKDFDQTKDIVQEVFIKVWQNRHQLEITGSLAAYLRRAAINTALNELERNKRRKIKEWNKISFQPLASNPTAQAVSYEELRKQADYAIQHLPVRTRTVFVLIRHEEMSYKEVSEALNISPKAVEKEMLRALRILRETLKDFLAPSMAIVLLQTI